MNWHENTPQSNAFSCWGAFWGEGLVCVKEMVAWIGECRKEEEKGGGDARKGRGEAEEHQRTSSK